MPTHRILLRGGTLLIHDEEGHVNPQVSDLLIENSIISKIERNIEVPAVDHGAVREIDCRGKIISPGFINTHHHLFASQLKGKPADQSMVEIFACYHQTAPEYTPTDALWGELSGALQCLDAGTTTIVDHSHAVITKHAKTLIQALATSGLRCILCYNPANPTDFSPAGVLGEFGAHAAKGPFGNGRVQLGFAIDNIYVPGEMLKPVYQAIRAAGAKLITTHAPGGTAFGERPSVVEILDKHALLDNDILLSHANYPKANDAARLQKSGAFLSTTVTGELHMGLAPLAMLPEFYEQSSLGTDGNLLGSEYMPRQMSALLGSARLQRAEDLAGQKKWSRFIGREVEEVFNLATIGGAKATGMAEQIGQIRVGFKADLLVFDGSSPGMLVAAEDNPLAAVVMYSSIRDLETVIVDGVIRKENGKILDIEFVDELPEIEAVVKAGTRMSWADVVHHTLESYERLNRKMEKIDMDSAVSITMDMYRMDKAACLEAAT